MQFNSIFVARAEVELQNRSSKTSCDFSAVFSAILIVAVGLFEMPLTKHGDFVAVSLFSRRTAFLVFAK